MKRALVVAALLGCHDKPAPAPAPIRDAAPPPDANLDACRAAIPTIARLAPSQRAKALFDACQPCGGWAPLLQWNLSEDSGGPSRRAIEDAMTACRAYCDNNAKQRFMGILDQSRGQPTRGPWRALAEACKGAVSAETDTRQAGAPYFALDRIARAVGDAALLAQIPMPLPALSVTGVGVALPVAPAIPADAGPAALTVSASELVLGALPIATLAPDGVHVAGDYPGAPVELKALGGKLAGLGTVAILAPRELPAARIADVVAAAGGHAMQLTVAAGGPGGWSLPGALPVALLAKPAPAGFKLALGADAGDAVRAAKLAQPGALTAAPVTVAIAPGATVAGLASLIGALGFLEVREAALVKSAKP
jgi:hypothetical protein